MIMILIVKAHKLMKMTYRIIKNQTYKKKKMILISKIMIFMKPQIQKYQNNKKFYMRDK